jgi:phosphate regulon transcriptional regulator PhoB
MAMAHKILIVDDEAPILDAVSYALRREGYKVTVAMNAEACMRAFNTEQPDLIVLDVMLPSVSGFDICKKIRTEHDTPIILLTARTEEQDRVQGLELGADDYVVKPFSVRELSARIKGILRRRSPSGQQQKKVVWGDITIDESRHEAVVSGQKLDLSPKEFALLAFFIRNPGLVFSRQALLDRVWGKDAYVDERTIDVHVSWLRGKLSQAGKDNWFKTIRGVGYKFSGEN